MMPRESLLLQLQYTNVTNSMRRARQNSLSAWAIVKSLKFPHFFRLQISTLLSNLTYLIIFFSFLYLLKAFFRIQLSLNPVLILGHSGLTKRISKHNIKTELYTIAFETLYDETCSYFVWVTWVFNYEGPILTFFLWAAEKHP